MRVGITGHRGLSGELERRARALLDTAVGGYDVSGLVGVSCLADGPDCWFARAVLRRGGRLEAVVPAEEYRSALPEWHRPEYDALLAAASVVHRTGRVAVDDRAHMVGSEVLVRRVDQVLAVWDGLPARGLGGTADAVGYAERRGVPVRVLWPDGAVR
jgi:hypothetical protein